MSEQARRDIENHMEDLKSYHSNYKDTRIEQIYSEIKDKLEAISKIKLEQVKNSPQVKSEVPEKQLVLSVNEHFSPKKSKPPAIKDEPTLAVNPPPNLKDAFESKLKENVDQAIVD